MGREGPAVPARTRHRDPDQRGSSQIPCGLHDPAALYLRGVAEALFAEIAWRADFEGTEHLEALFMPPGKTDRQTLRPSGNGLHVLLSRTNPRPELRHAITTVRIGKVATRSFDATAVALVRNGGRSEDRTQLADWSLSAERVDTAWWISSFQIEAIGKSDASRF